MTRGGKYLGLIPLTQAVIGGICAYYAFHVCGTWNALGHHFPMEWLWGNGPGRTFRYCSLKVNSNGMYPGLIGIGIYAQELFPEPHC